MFFFSPYQCSSRHAEEIHESVAEWAGLREANSGGCAGRAAHQRTEGDVETGLKCKCRSYPLRHLGGTFREARVGLTVIGSFA